MSATIPADRTPNFYIRNTEPEDFARVMEIYAHARDFMAAHGNPRQWGITNWPPESLVRQDIATGRGYVCCTEVPAGTAPAGGPADEGAEIPAEEPADIGAEIPEEEPEDPAREEIVAVFYFDYGKNIEPTYETIVEGKWKGNDTFGVVHRIAADSGNPLAKGAGSFCINWAFDQCGHLRIDTHGDNVVMQNLLTKLGFERCGTIYVVEDNDPRFAYEKM